MSVVVLEHMSLVVLGHAHGGSHREGWLSNGDVARGWGEGGGGGGGDRCVK